MQLLYSIRIRNVGVATPSICQSPHACILFLRSQLGKADIEAQFMQGRVSTKTSRHEVEGDRADNYVKCLVLWHMRIYGAQLRTISFHTMTNSRLPTP